MGTDIFIVEHVDDAMKAKLMRIARGLRQIDVASLAHVESIDVVRLEKDRYVPPARRKRMLRVLGLHSERDDGEET